MPMAGKTYKQEWIISGDRMWAPKGKGFIHVLKNDENILVASSAIWRDDRPPRRPQQQQEETVSLAGLADAVFYGPAAIVLD
jgi:hypothetical protein